MTSNYDVTSTRDSPHVGQVGNHLTEHEHWIHGQLFQVLRIVIPILVGEEQVDLETVSVNCRVSSL